MWFAAIAGEGRPITSLFAYRLLPILSGRPNTDFRYEQQAPALCATCISVCCGSAFSFFSNRPLATRPGAFSGWLAADERAILRRFFFLLFFSFWTDPF
jgi:hypothetical protein